MTAAADRYHQEGRPREAAATRRRAGAFAADGLRSDRETAKRLYTQASQQAKQANEPIQQAHAELARPSSSGPSPSSCSSTAAHKAWR